MCLRQAPLQNKVESDLNMKIQMLAVKEAKTYFEVFLKISSHFLSILLVAPLDV